MNRWFLIHFGNFSEWTDKMFVLVILLWKCIPNFCEWGPALCDCHMLPSLFPLFLECLATPNMVGETTVVFAQWMLLLDFCKNMFCCCCLVAKSCLTLLWPPSELSPTRLLCPWHFPGQNTGVDCHFLLQGIFQTQGLNPHLLHWQVGSWTLSHQGRVMCYLFPKPHWLCQRL